MLQLGNSIDVANCVFKQFQPIWFSTMLCVKDMVLSNPSCNTAGDSQFQSGLKEIPIKTMLPLIQFSIISNYARANVELVAEPSLLNTKPGPIMYYLFWGEADCLQNIFGLPLVGV